MMLCKTYSAHTRSFRHFFGSLSYYTFRIHFNICCIRYVCASTKCAFSLIRMVFFFSPKTTYDFFFRLCCCSWKVHGTWNVPSYKWMVFSKVRKIEKEKKKIDKFQLTLDYSSFHRNVCASFVFFLVAFVRLCRYSLPSTIQSFYFQTYLIKWMERIIFG